MKVVLFCHSLLSDWNHGNAHFLRGICADLQRRGHTVEAYEPEDSWSLTNLLEEMGRRSGNGDRPPDPVATLREELHRRYPGLDPVRYRAEALDLDRALENADLVLVHEWNDPKLVRRIGRHRARSGGYRLLFHDSHHRSVTDPEALDRVHLEDYDGVLAFGDAVREVYGRRGWGRRAWTWHEAADVHLFEPLDRPREGGLVWIGNWGDEERTRELHEFLLGPIGDLGLEATIHGVRYPAEALRAVRRAGASYRGWVANYRVPEVLARHRMTVHVPRRPYLEELRGVPTIRPFEALACGIPLVSARWDDPDGLFRAGEDFLVARTRDEMREHLEAIEGDGALRESLGREGRRTILARHTCGHRVDELLAIYSELEGEARSEPGGRPELETRSEPRLEARSDPALEATLEPTLESTLESTEEE